MNLTQRIQSFSGLGVFIEDELNNLSNPDSTALAALISAAAVKNPWFTPSNTINSLKAIAEWLHIDKLEKWTSVYKMPQVSRRTGIIMAGNIPLVGFHDFLSVLLSGHVAEVKCSSDDNILLPALSEQLIRMDSRWKDKIRFINRLEKPEAVIATGSNNSARYFEYYFGKYPHIIRKNRNSVAVLKGDENDDDFTGLGHDIFSYFGLGCRNISKLYVPEGYNFNKFFESIERFADLMNHNKYINNYDYQRAVFLLNSEPFLTNNFLIVREHDALATPVSVLHYQYYKDENQLKQLLNDAAQDVQCVAGKNYIPFGKSQQPSLTDYADGVDVMEFLSKI